MKTKPYDQHILEFSVTKTRTFNLLQLVEGFASAPVFMQHCSGFMDHQLFRGFVPSLPSPESLNSRRSTL